MLLVLDITKSSRPVSVYGTILKQTVISFAPDVTKLTNVAILWQISLCMENFLSFKSLALKGVITPVFPTIH